MAHVFIETQTQTKGACIVDVVPQDLAAYVPYVALLIFFLSIVGFWNQLGTWSKSEGAMESPMSITLKTEKTPAQVARAAREARRKRITYFLLLMVGGWLVLLLFDEPLAMSILDMFGSLVQQVLVALVDFLSLIVQQLSRDGTVQ